MRKNRLDLFRDNDTTHYKVIMINFNVKSTYYCYDLLHYERVISMTIVAYVKTRLHVCFFNAFTK